MSNLTKITLGELLSSSDNIIRNNATSILKQLQRKQNNSQQLEINKIWKCLECKKIHMKGTPCK